MKENPDRKKKIKVISSLMLNRTGIPKELKETASAEELSSYMF